MTDRQPFYLDKIAMALQWAAFDSMPENAIVNSRSVDNTALRLGRVVAANVLLPLTTELALKGLCQRTRTDESYKHIHDLLRLFRDLPGDTQQRVSARWQDYVDKDQQTRGRLLDLTAFLKLHRHDFVEWRYLDEAGQISPADRIGFQYAICAVLDEVYS